MRDEPMLLCDLTQSWSATGGGITTYLHEKRRFLHQRTDHRHLLIVPGEHDRTTREGRLTIVEIASPRVPESPNYRFLLRSRAVRAVLAEHRPAVVESLDPYNLPWAAMAHRKRHPETALVAGYRTDFPNVHIGRVGRAWFGTAIGNQLQSLSYRYAGAMYRRFDGVYALNAGAAATLERLGVHQVGLLPLGVDLTAFDPGQRDATWRTAIGARPDEPVLIYAGRIDNEKRADIVLDAFLKLPASLKAHLVMLGEGKLRAPLAARANGARVHLPGFERDRSRLARALASSDIYVSAMPDETFGISIVEAQAAGLPVVGVASGAMPDRVPPGAGYLGPVDDAVAMAANIARLWREGAVAAGTRGRAHAAGAYSWSRTFDHLLTDIYPRALARRGGSVPPERRIAGALAEIA